MMMKTINGDDEVSHGSGMRNLIENAFRRMFSTLEAQRDLNQSSNADQLPQSCHRTTLQIEHQSLELQLQELIGDSFNAHLLEECLATAEDNYGVGYTRISRVEQLETWDCGLACLLMILRWSQIDSRPSAPPPTTTTVETQNRHGLPHSMSDDESQQYRSLRSAIDSESIWTADLVFQLDSLLNQTSVQYLFCSKTFEVKNDYQDIGYYQAAFGKDQERVSAIFEQLVTPSRSNHLHHAVHGLPLNTVLNAVCHSNCVALVLIDNAILRRKTNPHQELSGGITCSYVGHYVILCGITRDPDHLKTAIEFDNSKNDELYQGRPSDVEFCVVLCDPGQGNPAWSFVAPDRFDQSRRAKGTDEDIIFFAKSCL